MTYLVLVDGSRRYIEYNRAARIKQIRDGLKEPENDEQAAFVAQVADIVFDKLEEPGAWWKQNLEPYGPDEVLEGILDDDGVRGLAKVQAVASRLKTRTRGTA